MTDPIIEAAARALFNFLGSDVPQDKGSNNYVNASRVVLAAVTPLIEARTLERAAQEAEMYVGYAPRGVGDMIAAAIRALKEQP